MAYVIEQLINGLAVGSVYALIAVGYSMVYSILYLINFAHGDVITFGAFTALTMLVIGVPIPVALFLACVLGAALGMTVERIAYRPVRYANRIVPMISALGAGLVIASTAQAIWGPEVHAFPQVIPRWSFELFGQLIPFQPLIIIAIAVVLVAIATVLLDYTRLGRATKCVCQDIHAAQLMGIPINTIVPLVYAIGGFLGVAGAILYVTYFNAVYIQMGLLATFKAWSAAMLGGVGNFHGAFVGGLLLGIAEAFSVVVVGSAFKDGVSLVFIVLILLLKPDGLFGERTTARS